MTTKCPSCGHVLDGHASRSLPDHRRFFAVIRATYHHWPESHEFQPDNEEHLRKWITAKAGYRDVVSIPVEFAEGQPAMLKLVALTVEAAVRAADGYAFIVPYNGCLAVVKAKSIAWNKLDQKQFNEIRDAIEAVIESETGLKIDQILKETEHAA